MKLVIFYEKPGCVTNAKQKKMLRASGYLIIERNLLEHGMDQATLRTFFAHLPVNEWFNPNAPKIKNNELDISGLDEAKALELMMAEPILIRRPLMVIGENRYCGFDHEDIRAIITGTEYAKEPETCSHTACASH